MSEQLYEHWAYYNPVKVFCGGLRSCLLNMSDENILLVTTPGFTSRGLTAEVIRWAGNCRVHIFDAVRPNPDVDELDGAVESLGKLRFSFVLAIGGGSSIDSAKAFSVALPQSSERPLSRILRDKDELDQGAVIPVIAVPTTSGTGSEVTPYATIWDRAKGVKYSLAGEHIFPATAVLDPSLTLSLPYKETLYSGLDAISHALESIWNLNRNFISELYAFAALDLAISSLPAVLAEPANVIARTNMQRASLFAGYAISITKTALAHAISYPLTAKLSIPHGLACSFTLTAIMKMLGTSDRVSDKDKQLFAKCQNMITGLKLSEEMQKYAESSVVFDLLPEMFEPSRIKNFCYETDEKYLSDIIRSSLDF